jgi:hypothetical protein
MKTEGGGRWEEGPRVRMRPRSAPEAELPALDPVGGALRDLERRFLESLSTSAQAIPTELQASYLGILAELREIDAGIQESMGRHDVPYFTDRRLGTLADHCEWLTKRVSGELMLLLQVQVERDLKRMISEEAYQLFLRLEEIETVARDLDELNGNALMERLREGTLIREILEQVRLGSGAPARPAPHESNSE